MLAAIAIFDPRDDTDRDQHESQTRRFGHSEGRRSGERQTCPQQDGDAAQQRQQRIHARPDSLMHRSIDDGEI